jgi:hypothetical protein
MPPPLHTLAPGKASSSDAVSLVEARRLYRLSGARSSAPIGVVYAGGAETTTGGSSSACAIKGNGVAAMSNASGFNLSFMVPTSLSLISGHRAAICPSASVLSDACWHRRQAKTLSKACAISLTVCFYSILLALFTSPVRQMTH